MNDIYKSLTDYFRFDKAKDVSQQVFEFLVVLVAVEIIFGAGGRV